MGLSRTPAPAPTTSLSVVIAEDAPALRRHLDAWQSLADHALEPNVFYEPWMLLPAVESFTADTDVFFALLYAHDPQRPGHSLLCGLFPLERKNRFKGLPVSVVSLWKHVHCYLCVPLIRPGYAEQCLTTLCHWLATDRHGGGLFELGHIPGEGPFAQALIDHLHHTGESFAIVDRFTRAHWQRDPADPAADPIVSSTRRKKIKRLEKHLADEGPLRYDQLTPTGDVQTWIDEFLHLEMTGWKGRAGTALGCDDRDRRFFETVAREAFRRGRLLMLALRLDGRPIAHLNNFVAADTSAAYGSAGSFAFKTAFDENFARFSPGTLLEVANLRRHTAHPDLHWMDSCTATAESSLAELVPGRRTIQTLLLATGREWGRLLVSLYPMLRWLRRRLRFTP